MCIIQAPFTQWFLAQCSEIIDYTRALIMDDYFAYARGYWISGVVTKLTRIVQVVMEALVATFIFAFSRIKLSNLISIGNT